MYVVCSVFEKDFLQQAAHKRRFPDSGSKALVTAALLLGLPAPFNERGANQ
jgi:hypothetical protein